MRTWILILSAFFIVACDDSTSDESLNKTENVMTDKTLIAHVKLAINPSFQDWILFENGTYIIFDNADTIDDMESEAMNMMQEFGPVQSGGPGGDFGVTSLIETEGWVVSGHGYGMYTYVHPNEIDQQTPSDVDVGLYGRAKRDLDGRDARLIHVNRKVE